MLSDDQDVITRDTGLDPRLWVAKYADHLYRYALTRVNDEEQARDVVQETFLAALERTESFKGASTEKTWLIAILKNKIIDIYRKKSSFQNWQATLQTETEPDYFDVEDGHWKTEHQPKEFGIESYDQLEGKEFNLVLKKCMQKLPALWTSVFTMKHIDDTDTAIICRSLNVTQSNFWVIIHRAKANLRACLQKNWI